MASDENDKKILDKKVMDAKIQYEQYHQKYKDVKRVFRQTKRKLRYIRESLKINQTILRRLQRDVVKTGKFVKSAKSEWKRISDRLPTHVTNPTCVVCATVVDNMEDVFKKQNKTCDATPQELCKSGFDTDEAMFSSCTSIMKEHCSTIKKQMTYMNFHPFSVCSSVSLC